MRRDSAGLTGGKSLARNAFSAGDVLTDPQRSRDSSHNGVPYLLRSSRAPSVL